MTTFDLRHLAQLAPHAREAYKAAFARADVLASSGLLASPLRLAHFLAQVCHESAGLTVHVENLNYSPERLLVVWPTRFPNLEVARLYAANPQRLAEKVYGNRPELGNVEPGDGWRFIGRGMLQLTGRANYARVGRAIGVDLVAHPYLATSAEHMLAIACADWRLKGCDRHGEADDLLKVTRAINGGLNGLEDRRAWLVKAKAVLGVSA